MALKQDRSKEVRVVKNLPDKCPGCGTAYHQECHGFGLAGGGFGSYVICWDCQLLVKVFWEDSEPHGEGGHEDV